MTAASVWADLAHQHEAARDVSHTKVENLLRDRVKGLVKREHCADRYLGKVTFKKGLRGDKAEIYVAGRDDTAWGEDIPCRISPTSIRSSSRFTSCSTTGNAAWPSTPSA